MRCWQCKYNYVDTYLHKYILTFAQSHKNKLKCFFPKKKKKKKIRVVTATKSQRGWNDRSFH